MAQGVAGVLGPGWSWSSQMSGEEHLLGSSILSSSGDPGRKSEEHRQGSCCGDGSREVLKGSPSFSGSPQDPIIPEPPDESAQFLFHQAAAQLYLLALSICKEPAHQTGNRWRPQAVTSDKPGSPSPSLPEFSLPTSSSH